MSARIIPMGDDFSTNPEADQLKAETKDLFGVDIDGDGDIPGVTTHPNFGGLILFDREGRRLIRSSVGLQSIAAMLRDTADELEFAGIEMYYGKDEDSDDTGTSSS